MRRSRLRWARNLKTHPGCPFGFNQVDRHSWVEEVEEVCVWGGDLLSVGNNLRDSSLLDVSDHP